MLNIVPLIERTIKHGNIIAEVLSHEIHMGGLQPDLTIRDELVPRRNASRCKQLSQLLWRKKNRLIRVYNGLFPKDMVSSWKMSGGVASLRARVDKNRLGAGLRSGLGVRK